MENWNKPPTPSERPDTRANDDCPMPYYDCQVFRKMVLRQMPLKWSKQHAVLHKKLEDRIREWGENYEIEGLESKPIRDLAGEIWGVLVFDTLGLRPDYPTEYIPGEEEDDHE